MRVGCEKVAGDAVVIGRDVRGRVEFRLNATEDGSPFGVEFSKAESELAGGFSQAIAEHFVGPGGQGGFGH